MAVTRELLLAYYGQDREDGRLRAGHGRLEFWRTQDVLRRTLPPAPARVLDVGGGTGVHAEWLAADGYDVELLDPVPLHVERASKLAGVAARLGDARELPVPDASVDAVLLLGPLYHLAERADRVRALAEARRAVRPGGVVAAATINRHAAVHDTVRTGSYVEERQRETAHAAMRDGHMLSPGGGFPAYFHDPDEVPGEFADAGLPNAERYGLEGAFWLYGDVEDWLDDPERRRLLLDAQRSMESAPSLLGVSGHLLTVARRQVRHEYGQG
ncbi:class I SAM-dependent methyltransferase [Streptosporangium sandarakinum]|uniref:SAM-dependent methyltransferase n=1 Tax=Streptosporangium sandarakinum TaxID=1260955 RepID=A0A852USX0_9ACTN|nr:class I SAM-dependent methyltransferase [Streptosporangium sandarakinum]NYF38214.1 SAM-dependent methyltransferase [Streptosporangium sandarakinum]